MVEAGQLFHRPLDILRPVVLAVDDDHVLRPADDEQIAICGVAHVAGVEPAVLQAVAGGFRVAEIGMHHGRAPAPHLADLVICLVRAVLAADGDVHVGQRLAAIDDRAVAGRTRQIARRARQALLLDQFDADAFAGRHHRHRQHRLGQAIGGGEAGGLEPRFGKGVDEVLHHVRADHVRAVARDAPARQIEALGNVALAGDAARADVVTEGGRIGERVALVAADHVEPRQRTAREGIGLEVIARNLIGDQRQQAADQPHVVIPRQPADAAVIRAEVHGGRMAVKVMQQRAVRHRHAGREAGRAGGILQVADIVRAGLRQFALGRGTPAEILPAFCRTTLPRRGCERHFGDLLGEQQDLRIRAHQLHRQLVDEAFLAAKAGRQRQRHRPGADIDAGAEQRGEIGPGLGNQGDAVFLADPGRDQAAGHDQRIFAHGRIGVDAGQFPAHVMKVEPLAALRGVVDRFVESCKLRADSRQVAIIRRRRQNGVGHIFQRYPSVTARSKAMPRSRSSVAPFRQS